jgi:LysM repeat protein
MRQGRGLVQLKAGFVCVCLLLSLAAAGCGSRPVARPCYYPQRQTAEPGRTQAPAERGETRVVESRLASPSAPHTITHEVAPLETIWRISRMYDVPEETILAANGLKPGESIYIGQKLVIPGARALRNVVPLYPSNKWKYIIVHHTATDVGKALLVHRSHEDRGFWNGIGYHFLIDNGSLGKGDGQIEVAPRWIKQQSGAHCKAGGMNEKAIGVALVGNFNTDLPTRKQLDSLTYLLNTLSRQYGIASNHIMGHRDVPGAATDCPGKRFPWATVRGMLRR